MDGEKKNAKGSPGNKVTGKKKEKQCKVQVRN